MLPARALPAYCLAVSAACTLVRLALAPLGRPRPRSIQQHTDYSETKESAISLRQHMLRAAGRPGSCRRSIFPWVGLHSRDAAYMMGASLVGGNRMLRAYLYNPISNSFSVADPTLRAFG